MILPAAAILLHATCLTRYGFFRDELYYLACARRLAWGYVDHPPFFVATVWLWVQAFGESLVALRAPLALAAGATVALSIVCARRMGATGWGLWLAGLFPLSAGMYLVVFHIATMNAYDILLWAVAACLAARLLTDPRWQDWLLLGVVFGFGLLNKASMAWLMAALLPALVAASRGRLLLSPWPYTALAIASAMWAPHIAWQADHGWPTAEFLRNSQAEKLLPVPLGEFLAQQAVVMNVAAVPFFAYGLWWAFRDRAEGRRWWPLAFVFVAVLGFLLVVGRSRVNYLAPAYPFVFPVAALAAQRLFSRRGWPAGRALVPVSAMGALTAPLGLPVLPIEWVERIARAVPMRPPDEEQGVRPAIQGYADMHGWPEMAALAHSAFLRIPEQERGRAVVVGFNYGEAAAVENFWPGARPAPVVSGHNNYYLWGPGAWDGRAAVFVNETRPEVRALFREWTIVGSTGHPWAMPEESQAEIAVARGLTVPVEQLWPKLRRFR